MTLPSDRGCGLTLAWDTSPLHHAIRADRIDVLSDIARGNPQTPWRNVRTAAVTEELRRHDLPVNGLGWLEEVHVDGLAELASPRQVGVRRVRPAGEPG